jgi:hypothetical protein
MLIEKDEWERKVFSEFAMAARLNVDPGSVSSGVPPQPDIKFTVQGSERWAELVEITDQDLARKHMQSLRSGAIVGGFFSQHVPLDRSITSKGTRNMRRTGRRSILPRTTISNIPQTASNPISFPKRWDQWPPA